MISSNKEVVLTIDGEDIIATINTGAQNNEIENSNHFFAIHFDRF